jgi:hypothetical protein
MKAIKLWVVTLMFVAGCATTGTGTTPAQTVFSATQKYDIALTAAVTYKNLPPCGGATPICSDKAVVATLQKADNVAYEALKSAQTVVRSTGQSATAMETAAAWALEAAGAFGRIASSLKTK